jgi:hypothetical protein
MRIAAGRQLGDLTDVAPVTAAYGRPRRSRQVVEEDVMTDAEQAHGRDSPATTDDRAEGRPINVRDRRRRQPGREKATNDRPDLLARVADAVSHCFEDDPKGDSGPAE